MPFIGTPCNGAQPSSPVNSTQGLVGAPGGGPGRKLALPAAPVCPWRGCSTSLFTPFVGFSFIADSLYTAPHSRGGKFRAGEVEKLERLMGTRAEEALKDFSGQKLIFFPPLANRSQT